MAKNDSTGVILFFLAATGGAAYYMHKHKIKLFKHEVRKENQGEAELKLKLSGFHAENDGTVMADIDVLNPTSLAFQVQSIVGDILVNGKTAGQVKMFGDTVVRANDESTLPVSVKVMPAAAAMFRMKGAEVQFRGEININNHLAPLTMDYKL